MLQLGKTTPSETLTAPSGTQFGPFVSAHPSINRALQDIYVIELACSVRIGKILAEFIFLEVYGQSPK